MGIYGHSLDKFFEDSADYSLIIYSELNYNEFLNENVSERIVFGKGNKKIEIEVRDKEGGGRSGKVNNHAPSVKLEVREGNRTLPIPIYIRRDNNSEVGKEVKEEFKKKYRNKIKSAVDFCNKNANTLIEIWNEKEEKKVFEKLDKIVNDNKDIEYKRSK